MILPTCCTDLDIAPMYLLFPDQMDEDSQAFVRAHGIEDISVAELRRGARKMPDGMVKISHRCQHLQDDGRCAIYEQRPAICRQFDCALRTDCPCKGKGRLG